MPNPIIEGQLNAAGLKFAIVVSRFNSIITDRLLAGALDAQARTGGNQPPEIVKVPGSWELPLVARELARQKRHDAVICLSAVIRGDTPHHEYIAAEGAKGGNKGFDAAMSAVEMGNLMRLLRAGA